MTLSSLDRLTLTTFFQLRHLIEKNLDFYWEASPIHFLKIFKADFPINIYFTFQKI